MKRILVIPMIAVALMAPNAALCDHHNTEAIKAMVEEHYANLRNGEFEKFFSHMAAGLTVYFSGDDSLLREFPMESRDGTIGWMTRVYGEGERWGQTPSHIQVQELGSAAVVTFYLGGERVRIQGNETVKSEIRDRATMVVAKEGDEWKIHHVHMTAMDPETEIPNEEE